MKKTACYIHIPFCDHKCIYCDFYSIITSESINPFLKALKKEIKYYSEKYRDKRELISIYFGGGTPSLMKPEYIASIIDSVKQNFNVKEDAEITLETNPGTVDGFKLKEFKNIGINRLSIGIQSFNDDELKFLTRIHDSKTAIETVENAAIAGFENISFDLIFNLPGQTKINWQSNLEQAVKLPVKHISAYSLILERGTILNKMILDGKVKMQDDDHDANLYETTIDFFEASNFHQYEVSNFAIRGYECLHNISYWNYTDYLGFGTSAHSFINERRWWNFSSAKKYIAEINERSNAVAGSEYLSDLQKHNEYVMLALRSSGLKLNEYKPRFGEEWLMEKNDYFQKLQSKNLITMNNNYIKFTKRGYALCDEILQNIL
ncbi:MAG: radical SAM family heme chaperone HemW [Ignavibacteriaceae bacterium]